LEVLPVKQGGRRWGRDSRSLPASLAGQPQTTVVSDGRNEREGGRGSSLGLFGNGGKGERKPREKMEGDDD